jgi:hypothetical protein
LLHLTLAQYRQVSMLIVGTEARQVLIMDTAGTAILKKIQLPDVPVFMAVSVLAARPRHAP